MLSKSGKRESSRSVILFTKGVASILANLGCIDFGERGTVQTGLELFFLINPRSVGLEETGMASIS